MFNGVNLKQLVQMSGYNKAQVDEYLHSKTIYGIRAESQAKPRGHCVYIQAYMRDKSATYNGANGAGTIASHCLPNDAMANNSKYQLVVRNLR
jgi:hypothetical protein